MLKARISPSHNAVSSIATLKLTVTSADNYKLVQAAGFYNKILSTAEGVVGP